MTRIAILTTRVPSSSQSFMRRTSTIFPLSMLGYMCPYPEIKPMHIPHLCEG